MGGVPFSKLSLKGQMKAHSYLVALLFPVRAFFFISVWDRALPPVPPPPLCCPPRAPPPLKN